MNLIPPKHLDENGKAKWCEILELTAVEAIDASALEMACVCWSRWQWAEETVLKEGFVIPTVQGGKIQHPAIQIGHRAMVQFFRWAHEFGMTPKARKAKPKEPTKTIADLLE